MTYPPLLSIEREIIRRLKDNMNLRLKQATFDIDTKNNEIRINIPEPHFWAYAGQQMLHPRVWWELSNVLCEIASFKLVHIALKIEGGENSPPWSSFNPQSVKEFYELIHSQPPDRK